jgi:hypothetical protein
MKLARDDPSWRQQVFQCRACHLTVIEGAREAAQQAAPMVKPEQPL